MIKKILALTLCAVFAVTGTQAQSIKYNYGAVIVAATMDGFANNYATYTAGTVSYEKTTREAQGGDYSLQLNCRERGHRLISQTTSSTNP